MLLKIAHRSVMMQLMVDLPSDHMYLVRFRARPFHTIKHQPSSKQAESLVKCPINFGDCSVYFIVYMLL